MGPAPQNEDVGLLSAVDFTTMVPIRLFLSIGVPFLACPHTESPTVWGSVFGPPILGSPTTTSIPSLRFLHTIP